MSVVGIDPSLNSLGLAARRTDGEHVAYAIASPNLRGEQRVAFLRDKVAGWLDRLNPSLVAYEGYALGFRGKSNAIFSLGELGGVLKLLILERGIDILLVPPTSLKMYVTGKGNADKDAVSNALRERIGVAFSTSDQYDATGLLLMGEAFLDRRKLPRDRKHHEYKAVKSCSFLQSFANVGEGCSRL